MHTDIVGDYVTFDEKTWEQLVCKCGPKGLAWQSAGENITTYSEVERKNNDVLSEDSVVETYLMGYLSQKYEYDQWPTSKWWLGHPVPKFSQ